MAFSDLDHLRSRRLGELSGVAERDKAGHVQILRGRILSLAETRFLQVWILPARQIQNPCPVAACLFGGQKDR